MTASYTFDVFSSLDGYGAAGGNWTGYWGKQGPELLDHRLALYAVEQRMIFGANTYRAFAGMLAASTDDSEVRDPWVDRMRSMPATVVSTTLEGPLKEWPNATVVNGNAVDVVARLKEESEVPLRSHGSLSLNRALMAAGLVDYVQVTLFPVITGQTGLDPIFRGAADFDLELIENRTLDRHIQELIYRPTLHQPHKANVVTVEDVRAVLAGLPRSSEVLVRDRVKFRVGQIVYVAFSQDETEIGFAFPKEERAALVAARPDAFFLPRESELRFHWVQAWLDALNADEMRELMLDAWADG